MEDKLCGKLTDTSKLSSSLGSASSRDEYNNGKVEIDRDAVGLEPSRAPVAYEHTALPLDGRLAPLKEEDDIEDTADEPLPLCLARRAAGLCNLGNTCFMNSSLQCLANIPGIRDYFLFGDSAQVFLKPSVGSSQPEMGDGLLAHSFADLVQSLWDDRTRRFAPLGFKRTVGLLTDRFGEDEQHDSMEFLEYLLDGLREDVSRLFGSTHKSEEPPLRATEAVEDSDSAISSVMHRYLSQKSSKIDELFVGFSKTSLACPDPQCGRRWAVVDPVLSVKLPGMDPRRSRELSFTMIVVPCTSSQGIVVHQHRIKVDKSGSVNNLIEASAAKVGLRGDRCILMEMSEGRVKFFVDVDIVTTLNAKLPLWLFELGHPSEQAVFREAVEHERTSGTVSEDSEEKRVCPDDGKSYTFKELATSFQGQYSEEDLRAYWRDAMAPLAVALPEGARCAVVVHCRRKTHAGHSREVFGIPLVFCMERSTTLQGMREGIRSQLIHCFGPECSGGWSLFQSSAGWDAAKADTLLASGEPVGNDSVSLGLRQCEHLVVDWTSVAPKQIAASFASRNIVPQAPEPDCTLETCFEWLTQAEELDQDNMVLCNGCGRKVKASAKVSLTALPPVLVVQLKRFHYKDGQRYRLSVPVRVPLESLDLHRFCEEAGMPMEQRSDGDHPAAEGPSPCYDLLAMSLHCGVASAGHYVAFVRSCENGSWYLFNDEVVAEVSAAEIEADQTGPYVLFYIRRDHRPESWGAPTPLSEQTST